MKKSPKADNDLLYQSLLQLQSVEECRRFMQDLCTVSELKAMEQRIEVAMYLREGMIYQDILKRTGASSATISRVNRCLQYGAEGYQAILPRMDAFWEEEKKKSCE
ncbi:MAG: YerC/YecD family TrpR-related protein [Bacillota bacterium]|nr:YerC/YecD family TrpR-related protein [Bacillota bacterium]